MQEAPEPGPVCYAMLQPHLPPQLIKAPPAPPRGLIGKRTVPVVLSPGFESSLQCQLVTLNKSHTLWPCLSLCVKRMFHFVFCLHDGGSRAPVTTGLVVVTSQAPAPKPPLMLCDLWQGLAPLSLGLSFLGWDKRMMISASRIVSLEFRWITQGCLVGIQPSLTNGTCGHLTWVRGCGRVALGSPSNCQFLKSRYIWLHLCIFAAPHAGS